MRPHHGLCLQFFIGKGYSSEFVKNMAYLRAKLDSEPTTCIKLCLGTDIICHACPNQTGAGCQSDPKPTRYDHKCLKACGFQIGEEVSWADLNDRIRSLILENIDTFAEICSDCSWFSICKGLYDKIY